MEQTSTSFIRLFMRLRRLINKVVEVRRKIFQKESEYAHRRSANCPNGHPVYAARYLLRAGGLESYTIDEKGLYLGSTFDDRVRYAVTFVPSPSDECRRMRQVLLPRDWDGRHAVVLIGGAGAYVAAYPAFIAHLLTGNALRPAVAVVWEDIAGYGFSSRGRRFGDVHDVSSLVAPQTSLIQDLPQLLGSITLSPIVVGLSLGGQLALHASIEQYSHLAGVLAISPLVRPAGIFGTSRFRKILNLLATLPVVRERYIYRSLFLTNAHHQETSAFYHEEFIYQKRRDGYMDDSVIPRALLAIMKGGERLFDVIPPMGFPVRLLHTPQDRTTDFRASEELVAHWKQYSKDVELESLPQGQHQLLNPGIEHIERVYHTIDRLLAGIWAYPRPSPDL